jgi:hypothetical protein
VNGVVDEAVVGLAVNIDPDPEDTDGELAGADDVLGDDAVVLELGDVLKGDGTLLEETNPVGDDPVLEERLRSGSNLVAGSDLPGEIHLLVVRQDGFGELLCEAVLENL